MDWSPEWSADEDEGSPLGSPGLEPAGSLATDTADFLGDRGFSGQLEALQDQLRSQASFYLEQGLFSSPPPRQGERVWGGEEEEDVLSEVLADLDGPAAEPSLADSLSRLLSRMLGLGGEAASAADGGAPGGGNGSGDVAAWNAAVGGGPPDVGHRLRMLQLGFPTAVEASRHAALAAEGVPANRMAPEPRQTVGLLPAVAGLWSLTGDDLEPRAPAQQHRMRRNFAFNHLREGLAMAGTRRPEPSDSAVLWLSEPESDGSDGLRHAAWQTSGRRRRRSRRNERPAVPSSRASTRHAARGAAAEGVSDDDIPDLVEDADSSSSDSDEVMPLLVHERAAWQPQPPRNPATGGSTGMGFGRSPSSWDEPPPLVSDGSDWSGEDSLSSLVSILRHGADAHSMRGLAADIAAPLRPLRTLRHSRQQGQEEGGEPPPSRRNGERSPTRRRERRAAIFGQLPGLGAGQLSALLEYGDGSRVESESSSDGLPDLVSVDDSGSEASFSGSLASLGSPPGLEPYRDYDTMASSSSSGDGIEDDRLSEGLARPGFGYQQDGTGGRVVPDVEPPLMAVHSLQQLEAASQHHMQGHFSQEAAALAGLAEAGPALGVSVAASVTGAGGLAAASGPPHSAGNPFSPSEVAAAVRQAVGVASASSEAAGQTAPHLAPPAEGPSGDRKPSAAGLASGSGNAGADQPAAGDATVRIGLAGRLLGAGAGLLRMLTGQGSAGAG
ncbi:hypothetical protein N2152v2_003097 [Parachlorella kessleri]